MTKFPSIEWGEKSADGPFRKGPTPSQTDCERYEGMTPRTLRHWCAALLVCALGALWFAPAASAGEYPIYACAVPGRVAADQGPWVAYATGDPTFASMPTSTCGPEGWFGRSDATSMHDTYPFAGGFAGFRAEVPTGKAIEIRRLQVNARIAYDLDLSSAGILRTQIRPSDQTICGGPQICDGTWTHNYVAGTKTADIGVVCAGGGDCKTGKTYRQQWRWTIITAAESQVPTTAVTGGQLLSGDAQRGTRRLAYTAADSESGVARIQVRFGDQTVAERRLADDQALCHHRSWVACPASASGEIDVDTTSVADGAHTVTILTSDAAGNEATAVAGVVTVDNVAPPTIVEAPRISGGPTVGTVLSGDAGRWTGATNAAPLMQWKRCDGSGCTAIPGATGATYRLTADDIGRQILLEATKANGIGETTTAQSTPTAAVSAVTAPATTSPVAAITRTQPLTPNGANATAKARLVARLAHGQATRRIRYGSAATVSGTLTDEDGKPISGASLIVLARVRVSGATPAPVATVTTDGRGTFTYKAPKGPSRELSFGYRAFAGDRDFASTTTVTVLVRSSVSLKTTPSKLRNGRTLRFTGTVHGRPHGKHGPLVDLQVVVHGKWRSFLRGAVRADRHGRFKASYRFLRTRTAQTYRFRAVARQDSAYPYLAGTSAQRKVRVRP